MDLAQLIRLAITASVLLLVFALGLRATAEDATYVLRRPVLILRGFLAMGVIVPAVAAALAALFQLNPAVEIALLAMAVGPVPPILPGKLLRLGGRASYVYGLLLAASLAAIVVVPLAISSPCPTASGAGACMSDAPRQLDDANRRGARHGARVLAGRGRSTPSARAEGPVPRPAARAARARRRAGAVRLGPPPVPDRARAAGARPRYGGSRSSGASVPTFASW
jgi:hypothetical protein